MNPLRSVILAAARSERVGRALGTVPLSRAVVERFVAGTGTADALRVTRELAAVGCHVTLDFLGEDVGTAAGAEAVVAAYTELLAELDRSGLAGRAECSVKLSALGQGFDGELAARHAETICAAAAAVGTTVTLDAEDHTTTDSTLRILARLRERFPQTGAVVQAQLRRAEADCAALADSRVRLCKGAYDEPAQVALGTLDEVRASYLRCAGRLLAGDGLPMFATHDPVLIEALLQRLARLPGRQAEFQMLYGVRPAEQRRLAAQGRLVRVYVPYGTQWYGYLMRRLAERPANLAFFLRALAGRR